MHSVRDHSLITLRGEGPYKREGGGGKSSFTPIKVQKRFSHVEEGGGDILSFEVVLMQALEVLAMLKGAGAKCVHVQEVLPSLQGEALTVSDLRFSHVVSPPIIQLMTGPLFEHLGMGGFAVAFI